MRRCAVRRRRADVARAARTRGPSGASGPGRRAACRRVRLATGIPAGCRPRLESSDSAAPGVDSGAARPGGENPVGCHWNGYDLSIRLGPVPARCAVTRKAGILRVLRTSLTSTSAFARQAGEHRMVGLNATTNSHAALADAIDLVVLRQCAPGRRDCAAKAGTAHVFRVALFVGVVPVSEAVCSEQLASTPAVEPSQA